MARKFTGKQIAAGGGIAVLALLATSDSVDAGAVLRGEEPLGESVQTAVNEARDDASSTDLIGDTFDFTDTPPAEHVAPGGVAEPSDGDPTTTDPRDPGGSQTNTPSEEQAQEETSDDWEDAGIIDGDNQVESESGGSGPDIGTVEPADGVTLNDSDGDGEVDSIGGLTL
jgi:hypothetical protein